MSLIPLPPKGAAYQWTNGTLNSKVESSNDYCSDKHSAIAHKL